MHAEKCAHRGCQNPQHESRMFCADHDSLRLPQTTHTEYAMVAKFKLIEVDKDPDDRKRS